MHKPFVAMVFLLVAALMAGNGCSTSTTKPLLKDGAVTSDAAAGSGGSSSGPEDGPPPGTGGSAGTPGTGGGAGGGIPDGRSDLPAGTGGTVDANRDVATTPGTGGAVGSGGQGGGSGGANTGGASSKGGSGGASGADGGVGVDGGSVEDLCSFQCRTDTSGVTGWYSGSKLLCAADCLGSRAVCLYGGSKSEGCYARGGGPGCQPSDDLIAYGTCAPVPYEGAFLTWQASGADTGAGPAVVLSSSVNGSGTIAKWSSTPPFPPESRPGSAGTIDTVTSYQIRDLWKRLETLDTTALPHEPLSTNGCSATLYYQLCRTCTGTTLTYGTPLSLTPEMEAIWSWFDELLSASHWANPRGYCMPVGADP